MINTGSFSTDMIFNSIGLTIYICAIVFFTGTVFGSFINCLAWRLVHRESVLKGRSHCAVCSHELSALDLVPVWSYIFLRGRCRYCHEKISPRYMITELIMGGLFLILLFRFGLGFELMRYCALACVLMALSLVDLDSYEIPDGCIIAAIIIWVLTAPFIHGSIGNTVFNGLLGAFVISGAMLIISLIFDRVTGKESLGGGDIKLFFIAGLYLGCLSGLLCIVISSITGLIFAALLKKQRIPFGPSISIGLIVCILVGYKVVTWYLNLL